VSTHVCCEVVSTGSSRITGEGARTAHSGPRLRILARRFREVAGWIGPAGILALLPKCPACLAVYFAIGTGIGISMSAAVYLRVLLVILCVAALAYVSVKQARRIFERTGRAW
jgi:hypothetical protein